MGESYLKTATEKRPQGINGLMSPKALSLKKTKDFKLVLKEGKAAKSPHFVLYSRKGASGNSRLGIRISSASIRLATRRNRVKRKAREFWRKAFSGFDQPKDFVLIVKRNTDKLSNEAIYKEISNIFHKFIP